MFHSKGLAGSQAGVPSPARDNDLLGISRNADPFPEALRLLDELGDPFGSQKDQGHQAENKYETQGKIHHSDLPDFAHEDVGGLLMQ
jgi:hypothetical protein